MTSSTFQPFKIRPQHEGNEIILCDTERFEVYFPLSVKVDSHDVHDLCVQSLQADCPAHVLNNLAYYKWMGIRTRKNKAEAMRVRRKLQKQHVITILSSATWYVEHWPDMSLKKSLKPNGMQKIVPWCCLVCIYVPKFNA